MTRHKTIILLTEKIFTQIKDQAKQLTRKKKTIANYCAKLDLFFSVISQCCVQEYYSTRRFQYYQCAVNNLVLLPVMQPPFSSEKPQCVMRDKPLETPSSPHPHPGENSFTKAFKYQCEKP